MRKMSIFFLLGRILPSSTGFPPAGLEEGQCSPYMVGATSKMKEMDKFLVKWRIQGYNSGR